MLSLALRRDNKVGVTNSKFNIMATKIKSLTVYRDVLTDSVISDLLDIFQANDSSARLIIYGKLYANLLKAHEENIYYTDNAWKNHLLNLIIWADNPGSRQAAIKGNELSESWRRVLKHDLEILELLFNIEIELSEITDLKHLGWDGLYLKNNQNSKHHPATLELIELLLTLKDWSKITDVLFEHYKKLGVGLFGKYHALYWNGNHQSICGVYNPDDVRFNNLFGYENERQQVMENTLMFLNGHPANNVLLYGDRGTGKSSTVKALVNEYSDLGLRVVELRKTELQDFSILIRKLSNLPYKFIVFLDDLSFEEHEIEYKALKAALEGGLEARPDNILLYATSNRRHLIRESFTQREDDIHKRDTVEEKMSLADRFGLQIAFQAPDQELFLHIVRKLAAQKNLAIDLLKLEKMAIQWEMRHSGRSGRVAKQFIDYLLGKDIS
jgi:predicted AAA+ superfamily ATPase